MWSEDLHPAKQFIIIDQSAPLISSAGAAAGIGATGAASAITGGAIGGTVGALGIGAVSFGVFAGSGLAHNVITYSLNISTFLSLTFVRLIITCAH